MHRIIITIIKPKEFFIYSIYFFTDMFTNSKPIHAVLRNTSEIRFDHNNLTCNRKSSSFPVGQFCPILRLISSKSLFILLFFSMLDQSKYVLIELQDFICKVCSIPLLSAVLVPLEN